MKNLLNLGKALNKAEQKSINGGQFTYTACNSNNCASLFIVSGFGGNGAACVFPISNTNSALCSGTVQDNTCCPS
ncbi:hypothetical protein [Winogradskyella wichelsiae]|uniref:hypothetical protein n=1 Tax=Winogradskyella wichelsiae TaxID=2697007 RepID=UPI0015C6B6BF|nr:hypothetical protein [Winogradskyella wichelsiae]